MTANTHMRSKNTLFCQTLQVTESAGVGETYTNKTKSVAFIQPSLLEVEAVQHQQQDPTDTAE